MHKRTKSRVRIIYITKRLRPCLHRTSIGRNKPITDTLFHISPTKNYTPLSRIPKNTLRRLSNSLIQIEIIKNNNWILTAQL